MASAIEKLYKEVRKHLDDDELRDVAKRGADAGWAGFVYYNETSKFYDDNHKEIWDLLGDMADDVGSKSILELLSGFGAAGTVENDDTFKNLLAWFALEEVARALEDGAVGEGKKGE